MPAEWDIAYWWVVSMKTIKLEFSIKWPWFFDLKWPWNSLIRSFLLKMRKAAYEDNFFNLVLIFQKLLIIDVKIKGRIIIKNIINSVKNPSNSILRYFRFTKTNRKRCSSALSHVFVELIIWNFLILELNVSSIIWDSSHYYVLSFSVFWRLYYGACFA